MFSLLTWGLIIILNSPLRVPAAEKSNEQLFFEERLAKDTDNAFTVKKSKKPLRSELSLHPNSAVPGFPPQKRKKGNKSSMIVTSGLTDSSGDDEGYDKSASYQTLHTQQSKKLAKWVRENPPKSTVILARKDLWSQDGEASSVCIIVVVFSLYIMSKVEDRVSTGCVNVFVQELLLLWVYQTIITRK